MSDTRQGWEQVGTDGELRRFIADRKDTQRLWALAGEEAAVQFMLMRLPGEALNYATADFGLHVAVERGYPGAYDCELLEWCRFTPNGNVGQTILERALPELRAGADEDETIFKALRVTWDQWGEGAWLR